MKLSQTASTDVCGPWYYPDNIATGLTAYRGTIITYAPFVSHVRDVQVVEVEECQWS